MQPTRILALLAGLALMRVTALSADESFVGKWKLNADKSQFAGLQYKIEAAGGNKYRFVFGDNVETVPLDGKDHLTKYGNTWAIAKTGPNKWKWTRKRDGKVITTATWTVSEDEQTFIDSSDSMRPDGSTSHEESRMKRTAGTSGLVGTWESVEVKITSPTTLEIEKWQGEGYSFLSPAYKERVDFKLDGKDYTPKGPRVAKGETMSAKRLDDHNIELTYKLKGKTISTESYEVSADGKTLTDILSFPGQSKSETDVYDRQ
jgi:hypothetical protein